MGRSYTASEEKARKVTLLEHMHKFARDLGHVPTAYEMTMEGPHSANTYKLRFGSWSNATEAYRERYGEPAEDGEASE